VMPLLRDGEVLGVLELFSGRAYAFEERDVLALQRIAEMALTAVEQAEAVQHAQAHIAGEAEEEQDILLVDDQVSPDLPSHDEVPVPAIVPAEPGPVLRSEGNLHSCARCGFPLSPDRTLCLDCEAAAGDQAENALPGTPAFLAAYNSASSRGSWLLSPMYWIGVLLLTGIVLAALHWLR